MVCIRWSEGVKEHHRACPLPRLSTYPKVEEEGGGRIYRSSQFTGLHPKFIACRAVRAGTITLPSLCNMDYLDMLLLASSRIRSCTLASLTEN